MKKLLIVLCVLVTVLVGVGKVSASDGHRVLLFGDSQTSTNMANWTYDVAYEYKLVAKGGQNTEWVLRQINTLVTTGEIDQYDTAVVWIGVNDPLRAVTEIPEIYEILHAHGLKIVGVTQYVPRFGSPTAETIAQIHEFNDYIRAHADIVVDFAVNSVFVDEEGYLRDEISLDGIHLKPREMRSIVASAINEAIATLYAPTPTPVPTATAMPTATATLRPTATSLPTMAVVESKAQETETPVKVAKPSLSKFGQTGVVLLIVFLLAFLATMLKGH